MYNDARVRRTATVPSSRRPAGAQPSLVPQAVLAHSSHGALSELAGFKLFTDRYHGKDSEWTFRPEHVQVRPYGILLANASHLKDVFGKEVAAWKGSIDLDF